MSSPQMPAGHQQASAPTPGETPWTESTGPSMAQMPQTAEPTQQAPEAATERRQEAHDQASPMDKVVHLHTAHPRVAIPYVTPGDMFKGARSGTTSRIPSLRKLTGYGILGGMAIAGALEWPIAVAVGVATEVITREQAARKRAERAEEQRRQPGAEPSVRTQAAQPGQTAIA